MPAIYLTPASISYLNQFLVSLLITTYLGLRFFSDRKTQPSKQDQLLVLFFTAATVFSLTLFGDVSLLPAARLPVVYIQNTILAVLLVCLTQFAYYFPDQTHSRPIERRLALLLTCAYALVEAGFAIWRFSLLPQGTVEYRPEILDYPPIAEFLWIIFIFARSAFLNRDSRVSRQFALIFLIPLGLALVNLLRTLELISTPAYHISMSIGILFTQFLFALNYLSSKPETTPLIAKFSGAALTCSLAVFGMLAWLVAPAYAVQYRPSWPDQRSLHFAANPQGGYTQTEIPFYFESDFGQKLALSDSSYTHPSFTAVDFNVPFFGRQYQKVFISDDGLLSFGAALKYQDLEYHFSALPVIFGLLLDLDPSANPDGGIYLRRLNGQLLITYFKVSSFNDPQNKYTFQIELDENGNFDLTYNGLPQDQQYFVNDRPQASMWAIGAKPAGISEISLANLPVQISPSGAIVDEYQAFRLSLHLFLLPFTMALLLSSLLFMVGLPMVLNAMLTRPLNTLLKGVDRLDHGQPFESIPIQFNDEIGFLTHSFNGMAAELDSLIKNLETRVEERTTELVSANELLRKLSIAVEQSPSTIIITDLEPKIEYVNPAFTRSTGYTLMDVSGQNPRLLKSGLTPPETYVEMWTRLLAGQAWRGELANRKKNGEFIWEYTVIAPIVDDKKNITHFVAVKEDITDRKKAEESLKESEKKYRDLFEMESDAIFIIRNEDFAILEANSAASVMYGYTHDELLQMANVDLSAEAEATQNATRSPLPTNRITTIPLRWHRKRDGQVFPVEITARFIEWQGQSVHIAAIRDFTERHHAEKELERLAITDSLTGLFNRGHFFTEAEKTFARSQKPQSELCVLMMDIDHFKIVNDTFGHDVGDEVLRQVTRRIQDNLRPTDLLARYGGEEFIALLVRTPHQDVSQIADRLVRSIHDQPVNVTGADIFVTISMGVAMHSEDIADLNELLTRADKSMYLAKQAGRNCWKSWRENNDLTGGLL
jgi:diguanylate cyclase (GGDEF)-like protein/PAS domain S-box-containing protein